MKPKALDHKIRNRLGHVNPRARLKSEFNQKLKELAFRRKGIGGSVESLTDIYIGVSVPVQSQIS
jgi:hypothetical protein